MNKEEFEKQSSELAEVFKKENACEPMIFPAMVQAFIDFDAVEKLDYNKFSSYHYRGVDSVTNKAHKVLAKNELFITKTTLKTEQTDRITKTGDAVIHTWTLIGYRFYAKDGSSVGTISDGTGIDKGDKSLKIAKTAAYTTMLVQVFCIANTNINIDAEKESPELISKQEGEHKGAAVPTSSPAPVSSASNKGVEPSNGSPANDKVLSNDSKTHQDSASSSTLLTPKSAIEMEYKGYPKDTKYIDISRDILYIMRAHVESQLRESFGNPALVVENKEKLAGIDIAVEIRNERERRDIESYSALGSIKLYDIVFKEKPSLKRRQEAFHQLLQKASKQVNKLNIEFLKTLKETIDEPLGKDLLINGERTSLCHGLSLDINTRLVASEVEDDKSCS